MPVFRVIHRPARALAPVIAEPLFQALDAEVNCSPVMNLDDLMRGLQELG